MNAAVVYWWFEAAPFDPAVLAGQCGAQQAPRIRVQSGDAGGPTTDAPRVRMLPATPADFDPDA